MRRPSSRAGLFAAREPTALLAVVSGAFAIGMCIPFESLEYVGYGNYVALVASAVLFVGAGLALLSTRMAAPRLVPAPVSVATLPPPGWYPDLSGQARERLWSGERWTDETRA